MATSHAGAFGALPPGMFGATAMPDANAFDALARQYWTQWGDWMRNAAAPAQPAAPTLDDAFNWWSRMAQGAQPRPQMGDALQRWDLQARDWMARMQQVASTFAGQPSSAADIAAAWRDAMGNAFDPTRLGFGGIDVQQWLRQAMPLLDAGRSWLDMPAFGFAREHQERWQRLTQAQLDYHTDSAAYFGLTSQALQDAFARFEAKLGERSEPGKQLTSARALFDLWIDAAEEAYADVALLPAFREAYGAHVNAQIRLKGALQREVEHATEAVGMPTRSEVDSAHRKIVQLEREVRRLRDAIGGNPSADDRAAAGTGSARKDVPADPRAEPAPMPPPADDAALEHADPTPRPASNEATMKQPAAARKTKSSGKKGTH